MSMLPQPSASSIPDLEPTSRCQPESDSPSQSDSPSPIRTFYLVYRLATDPEFSSQSNENRLTPVDTLRIGTNMAPLNNNFTLFRSEDVIPVLLADNHRIRVALLPIDLPSLQKNSLGKIDIFPSMDIQFVEEARNRNAHVKTNVVILGEELDLSDPTTFIKNGFLKEDTSDEHKSRLLTWAIERCETIPSQSKINFICYLISLGVPKVNRIKPFLTSVDNVDILSKLLDLGVADPYLLESLAIKAVNTSNLKALRLLVKANIKICSENSPGEDLLSRAVLVGSYDVFKFLLKSSDPSPKSWQAAALNAKNRGHKFILQAIEKRGMGPNGPIGPIADAPKPAPGSIVSSSATSTAVMNAIDSSLDDMARCFVVGCGVLILIKLVMR